MSPFQRPNDTSTGGAGGGGVGGLSGGSGRVMNVPPPRNRPFPWPFPGSAMQGAVGGAGGIGTVGVTLPPYYGPFQPYWPYGVPDQYFRGLPNLPLRA